MDPDLVTYLDRRFSEQSNELRQMMVVQSAEIRLELRQEMAAQSTELRTEMAAQSNGLQQMIEAQGSEMKRQFREMHVLIEGLGGQIEMVSEGVFANYEAHQRLHLELGRQFEEVKSMYRAPITEIARQAQNHDRRMDALEGRVADLALPTPERDR